MWSPITVALRALISPIGSVFYNTKIRTTDVYNMQTLLGHHLQEDGIEMQFYNEILLFLGRTLACIIFILLITGGLDFEILARIVIIVFAAWPVLHLKLVDWLEDRLIALKKL
jgi:hypothetical protein